MITVKLHEIVNSTEPLKKINKLPLKATVTYHLGKIIKACEVELKNFYEARTKKIDEYGEKDSDGKLVADENNIVKFSDENKARFTAEIHDLLQTDVTIDVNKINLSVLQNIDIDSETLTPVHWLIQE